VDSDTFTQQFSNNPGEKCAPIVLETRAPSSLFSLSPLARGVDAVPIGCRLEMDGSDVFAWGSPEVQGSVCVCVCVTAGGQMMATLYWELFTHTSTEGCKCLKETKITRRPSPMALSLRLACIDRVGRLSLLTLVLWIETYLYIELYLHSGGSI